MAVGDISRAFNHRLDEGDVLVAGPENGGIDILMDDGSDVADLMFFFFIREIMV